MKLNKTQQGAIWMILGVLSMALMDVMAKILGHNVPVAQIVWFRFLSQAILIGLDKITAKSSELEVNLNETIQFGLLEIKILKCGKVKINNKTDSVAYMQVKDLTKSQNEQVFIFNGWTFASDSSLTPFDHAIYDIKLLNCNKA